MSELIYREDAKDFVRQALSEGYDIIKYLDEVPAVDCPASAAASTVDAVTIEELEQLRDEMAKCEGGDSYLVYYGHEFRTDMGYAFDGIDMLIDCLKIKRKHKGVDE